MQFERKQATAVVEQRPYFLDGLVSEIKLGHCNVPVAGDLLKISTYTRKREDADAHYQ